MAAITVKRLVKKYGQLEAVKDISFSVEENEIFGLVGPNGAGKTTTMECIEGLRRPDQGSIEVLGLNPAEQRRELYHRIGVQLQETAYPDRVKVSEICRLFTAFYDQPLPYGKLLADFQLDEKKNAYISDLSGGQRQRLSIILALIGNPQIVFLDEITTGLDPPARRSMWELIRLLRVEGRTVFLTTHYMEEAENLCHRVCIMVNGEIIALDTVPELISGSGLQETVSFTADYCEPGVLQALPGVTAVRIEGDRVFVTGSGKDLLKTLTTHLVNNDIRFSELNSKKPGLEDVFLELAGPMTGNGEVSV